MTPGELERRFNRTVADRLSEATALSPYASLLGIAVRSVEPGVIVCTLSVRDPHHSGVGAVHGGAIASLIDHTLSLAVYPLVEVGTWVATVELKVNYLRPVAAGELVAEGTVEHLSRQLAVVRVAVANDGVPVALAQGTLMVRPTGPSSAAPRE